MHPDPLHPTPQHAATEFARRLNLILGALAILIAARFRILGDHTNPLWTRMNRIGRRITRLMARLAAGRPLPARQPRRGPRPQSPNPRLRAPELPRSYAWLVRTLGYEAAAYRAQLEALLEGPEFAALFAASPDMAARAGRTLRPLCHLLALTPPIALQRPPPPPRPARPRPPVPPSPHPSRPPVRQPIGLFGLPRLAPFPIFPPRKISI